MSHGLLKDALAAGVHVLWRAKSDTDLPVLDVLPDGTYLSRIADPAASRRMRRKGADPKDIPGIAVRVIEYSVTSADGSQISESFTLVTDITDPAALSSGAARGRLYAALAARPASMSWKPRSAAAPPSSCARSPRRLSARRSTPCSAATRPSAP